MDANYKVMNDAVINSLPPTVTDVNELETDEDGLTLAALFSIADSIDTDYNLGEIDQDEF